MYYISFYNFVGIVVTFALPFFQELPFILRVFFFESERHDMGKVIPFRKASMEYLVRKLGPSPLSIKGAKTSWFFSCKVQDLNQQVSLAMFLPVLLGHLDKTNVTDRNVLIDILYNMVQKTKK